ncbi:MAG: hypothetical protein ABI589_01220 [Burkholderiales bacterium]
MAWARLKLEARDLVELVLAPGLAALLPWPVSFAVFKRLARWRWLYSSQCNSALAQARARGWVKDEADWLLKRRLVTLVDHADFYLARTRGSGWMRRHLDVDGQWPAVGSAAVLCTFHWGAGMWGLRHAAAAGLNAHALVAPLSGAHFAGRRVLLAYARARTAEVSRALGCATLDVSASLRPAIRALRQGDQILAAVDVPADQVSASQEISLLGMRARVPRGLLRLAVDQKVPVTVYVTGIRMSDGRRFLRICNLPVHDDADALVDEVFKQLEKVIAEDAPAWHFWSEAERFFLAGDGLGQAEAAKLAADGAP